MDDKIYLRKTHRAMLASAPRELVSVPEMQAAATLEKEGLIEFSRPTQPRTYGSISLTEKGVEKLSQWRGRFPVNDADSVAIESLWRIIILLQASLQDEQVITRFLEEELRKERLASERLAFALFEERQIKAR